MPLEQQFELRRFEDQVRHLSREEAQELLIQLREIVLFTPGQYLQGDHQRILGYRQRLQRDSGKLDRCYPGRVIFWNSTGTR